MYVVAVDVGIVNIGLCVYSHDLTKIVFWSNVPLLAGGAYSPMHNVKYVRDFVYRYNMYFDNADAVIVERQMRGNMRIIEAVLQSLHYSKCIVVSPRAVKRHYDLSTQTYQGNKLKAVQWAERFVRNNAGAFDTPATTHNWQVSKKKDDMADSLLLVLYYLDTYSNQLSSADA